MAEIDKSVTLTDEIVDGLLDDWFERDGETFLKIRKRGRIGWEKTLEKDSSYSSYLLESPTQEDLIKRAYNLAKETIIVMDPPYKVHVKITTGSGDSFTDGKVVCVNTAMFDDPELSVGEKLDTFLGTTVHEGCHLLYTNFKALKDIDKKIVHTIFNILEDERIEEICADKKPGLANFLEKSKYYYFDQYYLDYVAPKEKEGDLTPLDRILNCILHIIRYPKYLKESEVIEFGHYLLEVKKVVLPYPETTEQTIIAAERIFDIIKDFYEDKERESSESSDGGKSSSEIYSDAMKKLEKDFDKIKDALEKVAGGSKSDSAAGGLSSKDVAEAVKKDGGLLGSICEGTIEIGDGKDTYFTKEDNNQLRYQESLGRVKRYIPAIAKVIKGHRKDYKLIHKSMRSGVLDTCKLAEAFQGVPTVYIREGQVRTDKVSVCVLIDESGSMAFGGRITAARDAAVLINESIGHIPDVELFIYGHSGDIRKYGATELYVYREKGYNPKYSLGACHARSENRDGVAILEVAKRVRKQTKHHVLFFILSDGAPCACHYNGKEAIRHVKECVHNAEKLDFSIIQVCINHSYDPGLMFKNYVIMENMSTLAMELGKAIKKATVLASKVHVS